MLRAVCFRQSRPHRRHSGFGQPLVLGDLMRGEKTLLDLGFAAFVAKLCDGRQ